MLPIKFNVGRFSSLVKFGKKRLPAMGKEEGRQ